ncbi:DUF3383 family protein [Lactobacillus amylolyticus]|uniref:DUF3383 family protein n=1 Tax=Lactobacillus amylolyticus TaxID=83683 RepID=UPI002490AA98|nr:DUF3383 family protein [Lactobacillus amylolyticus]
MADSNQTTTTAFDRVSDVDVVMTVIQPRPVVGLGNLLILNPKTASTSSSPTTGSSASTGSGTTAGSSTAGSGSTSPSAPASGSQTTQATTATSNNGSTQSVQTTLPDELSADDRENGILLRKTDPKTGAIYREYANAEAVSHDYDTDSIVYKKALTYFAQDNSSDRIAVLDYDPSKASDSLEAFWYFNWTFAIQAESNIDQDTVALSNIFEANKDHFLVLQTNNIDDYQQLNGQNYVIGLKHDPAEYMDAAIVGAVATLTVGSVTWKFKSLKGITPESLTTNELSGINSLHAIAYVEVNSIGETSEGWVLSGEYIDVNHGMIWIKTNMSGQLESFLQGNGKVSYDQAGITQLSGIVTQVLEQAYQQGIINQNETTGKGDYSVTASPRSEQSLADISARHYGGLNFTYHVSGAIHDITVNGEVQSDRILRS